MGCKRDGGLGIRKAKNSNVALIAKLGWKMHTDRDIFYWYSRWNESSMERCDRTKGYPLCEGNQVADNLADMGPRHRWCH
ncbi:hypothetical protein RHMOL_Rhmol07G0000900 [Rhododendron molle]|uniref:Uncharacterized protein n=1 Tax=Rhododendron molle TaxID=49168 RepID=A0ACC0MW87_RHOML|nr:hypothetical protein RHMOL_Rhmol07G0000900 [Rhododendron molle]